MMTMIGLDEISQEGNQVRGIKYKLQGIVDNDGWCQVSQAVENPSLNQDIIPVIFCLSGQPGNAFDNNVFYNKVGQKSNSKGNYNNGCIFNENNPPSPTIHFPSIFHCTS